uniref:Prominin-like protein n=1 Tax=Romanomermis culicivorax TaxID=13658 RepID=A0A915HMU1_ROMCU
MTNSSSSGWTNDSQDLWFLSRLSDSVFNLVQPNDFPEYLINDQDLRSWENFMSSMIKNKNKWIRYEQNLLICNFIVLLFAVFLVFGIIICFCYGWCFNRRDENVSTVKNVKNSKHFLANFVLFSLLLFISTPIVCSFLLNYRLNIGLTNFPHSVRMAVNDLEQYNENNVQNVKKILLNDYDIVLKTVLKDLSALPLSLAEQVKFASGAATLNHMSKLNEGTDAVENLLPCKQGRRPFSDFLSISQRLNSTKQSLTNLGGDFAVLVENMTLINRQIKKCTAKNYRNVAILKLCSRIKDFLSSFKNMDTGIFELQVLIDELSGEISRLQLDNLKSEISVTLRQFDKLSIIFRGRLQNGSKTFEEEITSYDQGLQILAVRMASDLQSLHVNNLKVYADSIEIFIQKFEIYRLIITYGISLIMSVMTLSFTLGLLYNVCGTRPSSNSHNRCIWTKAAKFFCCGISLCITFILFLVLLTIVASIVGVNIRNICCRGLMQHNEYPAFLNVMQRYARISDDSIQIPILKYIAKEEKVHSVINDCSTKGNFFEAFDYGRKFAASLKLHQTTDHLKFENTILMLNPGNVNNSRETINDTNNDQSDQLYQFFVENLNAVQRNYKISAFGKNALLIVHNLTLIDGQLKNILNDIPANVSLAKNARKLLNDDLTNVMGSVIKNNIFRLQNYFHIYNSHLLKENWLWICIGIGAICSMPACILAAFLREACWRSCTSNRSKKFTCMSDWQIADRDQAMDNTVARARSPRAFRNNLYDATDFY